jgi:hypothetical protein
VAENISNTGNAQAVFQLGMRLDSNRVQEFDVSANSEHSTSTYVEGVNGPATSVTVVLTHDSSYVNRLMHTVMSSGDPDVLVRLGLGTPGNFFYTPWQQHVITHFSAVPHSIGERDGFQVKIHTADVLSRIDRVNYKAVARKGKISAIVEQIAADQQIVSVVEPTVGVVSLIQSFESDFDFIIQRLAGRALNSKGRGNYRLYVKDNALHFHTIDYQASVKDLNYFFKSSAFQLIMTDRSQECLMHGAAGVKAVLYDTLTGEIRTSESKAENVLKLGNSTPDFSGVTGAARPLLMHVGQNLVADCDGVVQSMYERERSQMYELLLMTSKTSTLRVNDLLSINLNPTPSKVSPWTGYYAVSSVKHIIEKGDLVSSFILNRGETNTNQGDFAGLKSIDLKTISGANDAPGQSLNVKEVESSALTRGPESSRVRTVLNPELA